MDQGFQSNLSISSISKMEELKEGDHIVVKGKVADFHPRMKDLYFIVEEYYFHHGIYIGNNKVVDFGGDSKSDAKVREIDILQFVSSSCDSKIYRVNDDTGSRSASQVRETLARAYEMLKDPSKWPGYNVFWNNCESFANYLKNGKAFTEQGKEALRRALIALIFVGASATFSSGAAIGASGALVASYKAPRRGDEEK